MFGRRISSFILATVFLPLFLMVSFHHHGPYSEAVCDNCSQNIPHSHLSQNTDVCLVCQFLTVLWLTSAEEEFRASVPDGIWIEDTEVDGPHNLVAENFSTRAPPFFFC